MQNEIGQITNRYIKGEERSFTIIAYPVPAIGDQFEEIFRETVKSIRWTIICISRFSKS